jgi:hypothetical protein
VTKNAQFIQTRKLFLQLYSICSLFTKYDQGSKFLAVTFTLLIWLTFSVCRWSAHSSIHLQPHTLIHTLPTDPRIRSRTYALAQPYMLPLTHTHTHTPQHPLTCLRTYALTQSHMLSRARAHTHTHQRTDFTHHPQSHSHTLAQCFLTHTHKHQHTDIAHHPQSHPHTGPVTYAPSHTRTQHARFRLLFQLDFTNCHWLCIVVWMTLSNACVRLNQEVCIYARITLLNVIIYTALCYYIGLLDRINHSKSTVIMVNICKWKLIIISDWVREFSRE